MRALLVYNPNATVTTPGVTDVITRALADELKLDVEATKRRDHASYLAAGAVHAGYEVVVALGGDGTVNEVLQGIAGTSVQLAIVPGGSTNVWARSLGLPADPVEATARILELLAARKDRVVGLGSANGRYFGVNCGLGFDAEVVRLVEARHRLKRTVRQASFLYCGLLAYLGRYGSRAGSIRLEAPGEEPAVGLRSVICCNTDPFTYLGERPARVCPRADIDAGLDVTALSSYGLSRVARLGLHALRSSGVQGLRSTLSWHDREAYELRADSPIPLQLDGDYVGEVDAVSLRSHPRTLRIVA